MGRRFLQAIVAGLMCLDMTAQWIIFCVPFVLFGYPMQARWTISGQSGKLAINGFPYLANLIDDMPWFGKGHCARAYQTDQEILALGV